MSHDFVFRLVLVGDSCVGKTKMIMKYTQNDLLNLRTIATISMDFYTQNVTTVDGLTVKVGLSKRHLSSTRFLKDLIKLYMRPSVSRIEAVVLVLCGTWHFKKY